MNPGSRTPDTPVSLNTLRSAVSEAVRGAADYTEKNPAGRGAPSPVSSPSVNCRVCGGKGYLFDPLGAGRSKGAFTLCDCVRNATLCDGTPPYDYYDRERNAMLPCPSKPARLALDGINYLRKRSGIPARYEWQFLENLIQQNQREADANSDWLMAADAVRFMIADYMDKREVRGIYLYGDTGCGKTLLSCAALNELIAHHRLPVKYAKISRDVLGKLRASFNPNSDFYGEGRKIEEELASVTALVIDDIGVHRESDWVNSVLYDLIDARYEANLLTIITSNEPMDAWKDIAGGRVYSRLRQMCTECHIDAPDYRLRDSVSLT